MLTMQKDVSKNVKDTANNFGIVLKDTVISISYTKTSKLITALYMVTDIIDKNEPLRNKLRTLGTEIISDIYSTPSFACTKISETMSFLDIASTIDIISEMNCNILRKEFTKLAQTIKESYNKIQSSDSQISLLNFFKEEKLLQKSTQRIKSKSIGHQYSTRIGVQKGSTLMQALSDRTELLSNRNTQVFKRSNFEILKKKRQENILNIIIKNGGSATIKDIRTNINKIPNMHACGEKTLQRELVSMKKDGVLNKTGEKRWSKYFIKSTPPDLPLSEKGIMT